MLGRGQTAPGRVGAHPRSALAAPAAASFGPAPAVRATASRPASRPGRGPRAGCWAGAGRLRGDAVLLHGRPWWPLAVSFRPAAASFGPAPAVRVAARKPTSRPGREPRARTLGRSPAAPRRRCAPPWAALAAPAAASSGPELRRSGRRPGGPPAGPAESHGADAGQEPGGSEAGRFRVRLGHIRQRCGGARICGGNLGNVYYPRRLGPAWAGALFLRGGDSKRTTASVHPGHWADAGRFWV